MQNLKSNRLRARKGTTCVHCRRMKLRCDSDDKFPAACSRCARSGRSCSINENASRSVLVAREKQASLTGTDSVSREDSIDLPADIDSPGDITSLDMNSGSVDQASQIYHLEDIELSSADFLFLLDEFYQSFHEKMPFLPGKPIVLKACYSSPLLFWAIVSVSSRFHEQHRDLYAKLAWPVRRLAVEASFKELPSLWIVQALLLLCIWPLPFAAIQDDPSWTMCGIATHMALHLGLHRHGFEKDFRCSIDDKEHIKTRRSTWVTCFIVNQSTSSRLGLPPTVRLDQTVLRTQDLEPVLRRMAEIYTIDHRTSLLLGHDLGSTNGLRQDPILIVRSAEAELDALAAQLGPLPPQLERLLLDAKLRLFSFVTFRRSRRNDSQEAENTPYQSPIDIIDYVSKTYQVSWKVIQSTLQDSDDQERTWTAFDITGLEYATVALLTLFQQQHIPASDMSEARNTFRQIWTLLKKCSLIEGDHFDRICDSFEYMTTKIMAACNDPSDRPGKEPNVQSRMSANVIFAFAQQSRGRFLEGRTQHKKQLAETPKGDVADPGQGLAATGDPTLGQGLLDMPLDPYSWNDWDQAFLNGFEFTF